MYRMYVFQILDVESGRLCGPGEVGEICVHAATTMLGYLDAAENRSFFLDPDNDGLVYGRSGDLGRYSEEGNLYFVDRIKEIIK